MPDARMSHHHVPHGYQPVPPGYGPPASRSHPTYHHPSSHHPTNGPPPSAPPPMTMGHEAPMGNGHSHGPMPSGPAAAGPTVRKARDDMDKMFSSLAQANENTWMLIGAVAEQMNDQDRALSAFENALRHNPTSTLGLNAVASIYRNRDMFDKAIEYFQRILNLKQDNGEAWGSMGHCLLMKDDLPKAYTAYQQALYHLPNPKEPKLWYGIGILYDRYGSFEHAEEAFTSVLKMDPNFEKANEIYFRLGIIYKHQRKYAQSLECFRYILSNPPRPLTSWDIWFQLGHVYEQDRDYDSAKDAYMRVLTHQPDHAKVLQQLGWLYHQQGAAFADQDKAVQYLTKSLETDGSDAQSWYLLGRAFMAGQRYNKAYESYQQAVYRDGRNPTFWCSIGVLYYQINQYRDALDAYSRAIRLNPYISEVWYNLGSLYESCNNQVTDAIDAYSRASELDPGNAQIKQRLHMLQNMGNSSAPLPPAPGPVDVHPSQYTAAPGGAYPGESPGGSPRPGGLPPDLRSDGPPTGGRDLLPPPPVDGPRAVSPGPFRGGAAPPPLNHVDESRGAMSRHAPLAPMETTRQEEARERDGRHDPRDPHYREHAARYDGPDARRRDTAGSPRHRDGYATYPNYPPAGYRDRERDEWERRERERHRGGPPGHGPRAPSPRMPAPPIDRRPSPHTSEAERYGRPAEHGYDRSYPGDPRYEIKREDPRDPRDARRASNEHKSGEWANGRHAALSRDPRDDPRIPSPAPSSTSLAGAKRNRESGIAPPLPKKAREEPGASTSKKSSGSPPGRAPARAIDEGKYLALQGSTGLMKDYDEGAEALMFLHGDRRSNGGPSPPETSPRHESGAGGVKRTDPPSPSAAPAAVKKAKADGNSPSKASPGPASTKSRQVIEVLNADRVNSPRPGGSPAPGSNGNGDMKRKVSDSEATPAPTPTPAVEAAAAPPAQEAVEEKAEETRPATPPVETEEAAAPAPEAVAEVEVEVAQESKEDLPKADEDVSMENTEEAPAPAPPAAEEAAEVPASAAEESAQEEAVPAE